MKTTRHSGQKPPERLDWIEFPTTTKDVSFDKADLHIRWYEDGVLNACYNCVDRHLDTRGDQTAIIWEGDDPARDEHISYRELHATRLPDGQRAEKAGR